MNKFVEVTIYLEVTDAAALVAAARQRLVEIGVAGDDADAADIIADGDVRLALRHLLDPGTPPSGAEILDSVASFEGENAA